MSTTPDQDGKGYRPPIKTGPAALPVVIAVPKELAADEQRVAMVPEIAKKLIESGCEVRIEHDAGTGAFYPDDLFTTAGAKIAPDSSGAASMVPVSCCGCSPRPLRTSTGLLKGRLSSGS